MPSARRHGLITTGWLCVIAAFSTLPLWFYQVGGDCFLHLVRMDLFARQFWQGDIYPRWLMDANSGLGSPTFLFYFPLPYYPAALLYPLHVFGYSSYQVYILCCTLAGLVSACTCYLFVRDLGSHRTALLAALLYLLMPYRTEALYYRSAYAELWGMAFLPLVARYARRLAQGGRCDAVPMLALSIGLLLLSHLSCALCGLIIVSVYALAGGIGHGAWRRYALALGWGVLLAAFYLLPAEHYKQFILDDGRVDIVNFSIGFVNAENWQERRRILLVIATNISAVIAFFTFLLPKMRRLDNTFFRQELMAWGLAILWCILLLFPISQPLYEWMNPVSRFVLPWRMQNLFGLFTVLLIAIWMERIAPVRKQRTMATDTILFSILLLLVGLFQTSNMGGGRGIYDNMEKTHFSLYREYRTRWIPAANYNAEYLMARLQQPEPQRQAVVLQGEGEVRVQSWSWRGITLDTQARGALRLRLGQYYFPLWRAAGGDGAALEMSPSESGELLVDVPAGATRVTLTPSLLEASPGTRLSAPLSLATWLVLAFMLLRCHRAAITLTYARVRANWCSK